MRKTALFIILTLMAGCSRDPKVERDKYSASGQKYMESKKYEEAAIEFRNALRIDKEHIPSHLGIAKAFQQMGNHRDAVAVYQEVMKLDGKNVQARLALGEYLLAGGIRQADLFKQAQQMAEEVLKVEPENIEALILLGNAYSGQNEVDKATPLYERALAMDPDNIKARLNLAAVKMRKNDLQGAEIAFREALQRHPDDIPVLLAIAGFYSATERPQETENYLKKAFNIAPSDSRSLNALSTFYLAAKKNAEAENVFKEAIERMPDEREPRWGLADFYLKLGNMDASIQALNDLLDVHKSDHMALLRLAEIYLNQNNEAKAEENIRAVLASNKNEAQAHYLQGKIFRRRREFDKAMTEFEAAIKFDPSLAPAYLEKANLLIMRGDMDTCESTLKEVLQLNRNYLPARGAYAKLLALRQRPQDALQQAQEVLAVYPENEDAIGARAEALRLSGRLEESRRDWLKLCEMQPGNSDYWRRLGIVELMIGDKSKSLAAFRKALDLRRDFSAAINDILYLHIRDKQFDAALAELDRLAQSSTPKDELCKFRGQVYMAKGDLSAAEAQFKRAVQINPKNYQTYILLAQLNMQRNNIPQAIREVDQLIAQNDKSAAAYLQKAYYLQLSKDNAGAIANYRKTLALDSENPIAANNLAWLLCEQNTDLQEALSLARAAKKRLPEDPEIADTLGWIYHKLNNFTLAVDQLLFSVNNRNQPSAENYYRLGIALNAKGDVYHAKQTLRKALELDPHIAGAEEARKIISAN
jgi:tetratricopeptide (TPR) repeat protein